MYSLRLRSCRSMGAFIMSPLPPMLSKSSCAVRSPRSTGVTPLHHYYGPRRHRLAFGRFPGETGYTAYLAPAISAWGEDGFSSCLACPCHRAVPTTPSEECASTVSLRRSLLPSLDHRELGLRDYFLSGPPMGSLVLRPGDSLTILTMALSVSFTSFVSSTSVTQATGR